MMYVHLCIANDAKRCRFVSKNQPGERNDGGRDMSRHRGARQREAQSDRRHHGAQTPADAGSFPFARCCCVWLFLPHRSMAFRCTRSCRRVAWLNCATCSVAERKRNFALVCSTAYARLRRNLGTTKAARCWALCSFSSPISPIIATWCWFER